MVHQYDRVESNPSLECGKVSQTKPRKSRGRQKKKTSQKGEFKDVRTGTGTAIAYGKMKSVSMYHEFVSILFLTVSMYQNFHNLESINTYQYV